VSSDAVKEPFCPLYREAVAAAPWKRADSAHAGLLFDKFANAWRRDHQTVYAFDKGGRTKKERDKREHEKQNYWLMRVFPQWYRPSAQMLQEACTRQRQLVERAGGRIVELVNHSRFVTGMGREHPLENGFAWHPTLGVPYLPGSSLKGMLRAWLREQEGTLTKNGNHVLEETEEIKRWFGTPGQVGQLVLFDMLPLAPPQLTADVMTPHYGPYYQEGELPGDWHSPVPICFLVVEQGARWQLGIAPAAAKRAPSGTEFDKLVDALVEALEISGAGAKTAVGYGRFVRPDKAPPTPVQPGQRQRDREPETDRTKPRYQRGEKVTVTRIEDSAKGKPRFRADDGFIGHFASEDPPEVDQGHTVQVWIANITGQGYTFTLREPKRRGQSRRRH